MAKGQHKSDKEQYAGYAAKLTRLANRKRKLARHLKKHPQDAQAETATKKDGVHRTSAGTKGSFPLKRDFVYDGAGQKTEVPAFIPPHSVRDAK